MNKYLTILYSTALLVACSTTEDPILPSPTPGDGLVAIDFAPNLSDQETTTRATNHPLEQDFVVSGYKILKEEPKQLVFDKVTVSYNPGSTNNPYNYINPDPENPQYYRYWDSNASEYRFWAYSTSGIVPTYSETSDVVTMSVGDDSTPIKELEALYYSEIKQSIPDDYINKDKKVTLVFKQLFTIVEIRFFTNILLSDVPFENIYLSDIIFAPKSKEEKISVKGQIEIDYPLVGEPNETITWPEGTLSEMEFDDVTLTETNSGKENAQTAIPKTETGTNLSVYTIYPTISETTSFLLSLKVNEENKEAEVLAKDISWKANFKYVYLFKVNEDLEPVLFDVKVEPWGWGGQQDLEFKNW